MVQITPHTPPGERMAALEVEVVGMSARLDQHEEREADRHRQVMAKFDEVHERIDEVHGRINRRERRRYGMWLTVAGAAISMLLASNGWLIARLMGG